MQDGLPTERLQKEIKNGLQQETLHAEDNQNTARVEKNPKKEGKVADSPDGAAGVVMEGLDGAEDEAEVLPSTSKKKKRRGKRKSPWSRRGTRKEHNSGTPTTTPEEMSRL